MARETDNGWNLDAALSALRASMDPYIWDQGQELFRRGAVEDVAVRGDGVVQVKVLDPRDARAFFVEIRKDHRGDVLSSCQCPYRLGDHCRHQVVGMEYLRSVAAGGEAVDEETAGAAVGAGADDALAIRGAGGEGSMLYRLFDAGDSVTTCADGSLLRVVVHGLGSLRSPHRLALQLFTGTGWTEVRTPDVARWIRRGEHGPHPRDAVVAGALLGDDGVRSSVDSETLGALLSALAGSEALVDRAGTVLSVSPWPCTLVARILKAGEGVGLELTCRSRDGAERPFEDVSLIPSVAPWIQLESGVFHGLIAGAPGPYLEELQLEDVSRIAPEDLDRFLAEGVGHLERLCPGSVEMEPGLIRDVEGVDGARLRLSGTTTRLSGQLELSYGGEWVVAPATPEPWTVQREGQVHRYPPAGQSMARAREDLESVGFHRDEERWVIEGAGVLARVLGERRRPFVDIELPDKLVAKDLVHRAPQLVLRVGGGAPGGVAGVDRGDSGGAEPGPGGRSSGIAWLEVSCRVRDGQRELPIDVESLQQARAAGEHLLSLEDGSVLSLKHDSVRALDELARRPETAPGAGAGELRLPLPAIADLLEERPGRQVEFDASVRSLADSLREAPAAEVDLRDAIGDFLRPYQRAAIGWFGGLSRWGLGGILADEMGLGKTVMALAHFFGRKLAGGEQPPVRGTVLVVCPTSLIFNWLDECARFFPEVDAVGLHGKNAAARQEAIAKGAGLLITSYGLLRRDREALEAAELRAVVLDEAQHIKNPDSQTARAACSLRTAERWALTGTPVENHLGELWSQFRFLMPDLLGSRADFQVTFAEPIAAGDRGALDALRRRIRPFLLRRTKEQVLEELPPRIDQVERVPMTAVQRRLYEAQLLAARSELEGVDAAGARFKVLAALTRLRQICCHPRLVLDDDAWEEAQGDGPASAEGGKFGLLLELLEECIDEGHRVLVFSQFTSMLDLIEARLDDLSVRRRRLDGSTRDREGEVRRFREDDGIPVFLISLKAGGLGLNLTEADTVILYDPWWNPAVEDQAASRAHRMGQELPVHIHKLITIGTVEEKILDLQASKRDLSAGVMLSEEETLEALGADELKALLYGER